MQHERAELPPSVEQPDWEASNNPHSAQKEGHLRASFVAVKAASYFQAA